LSPFNTANTALNLKFGLCLFLDIPI
jgi:hypothetical protein